MITSLLLAEFNATGTLALGRFYARRSLRLAPPFVVAVLICSTAALGLGWQPGDMLTSSAIALAYLMNWNIAFDWASPGIFPHSWSLAAEEQFYLLWPLMLLASPAKWRLPMVLGLLTILVPWRCYLMATGATNRAVYGLDTHADGLLIGCALALGLRQSHAGFGATLRKTAIVPVVFPCWFALSGGEFSYFPAGVQYLVVSLAAGWILVAALADGFLRTLLSKQPLPYLGKLSYGIYLWHWPLLMLGWKAQLPYSKTLMVAGSVAAAALSYHFVESWARRYKARLTPAPHPTVSLDEQMPEGIEQGMESAADRILPAPQIEPVSGGDGGSHSARISL